MFLVEILFGSVLRLFDPAFSVPRPMLAGRAFNTSCSQNLFNAGNIAAAIDIRKPILV